mgnify:CR=1 FL=1
MKDEEAKWQAEGDLRTLVESNKIKKDKKRMAAAMKMATEQKKALSQIKG